MVAGDPDSPSTHVYFTQASEGLSPPFLETTASPDIHFDSAEAAQISAEHPALCQDLESFQSRQTPFADTFDFDKFPDSNYLAEIDLSLWTDDSCLLPNTGLEQVCVVKQGLQSEQACDPQPLEASACEFVHSVVELTRAKRPVPSSPPSPSSEFVQKRQKVTQMLLASSQSTRPELSSYNQRAEGLVKAPQSLEVINTSAQPPETPSTTPAMTEEVQKTKRSLPCPSRKAQAKLGLPYTCAAAPVTTVSAVRTHLTRTLPEKNPPHLPFLKLCKACNEDILDPHEFETSHGKNGFKCHITRQQRKGDAGQQEQYDILCSKVEAYIIAQRSQTSAKPLAAAEHHVTLPRPAPTTEDAVHALPSSIPAQASAAVPVEHPRSPTLGEGSPHPQTAKKNPREDYRISHLSAELDKYLADHDLIGSAADCGNNAPAPSESMKPYIVRQENTGSWAFGATELAGPPCGGHEEPQIQIYSDFMEIDEPDEEVFSPLIPTPRIDYRHDHSSSFHYPSPWSAYEPAGDIVTKEPISGVSLSMTTHSTFYCRANTPPVYTAPTSSWHDNISSSMSVSADSGVSSIQSTTMVPSEPGSPTSSIEPLEIHCSVDGCCKVFSGTYRKGNLARHKRLKHMKQSGPTVYPCQDESCNKVFSRQDARLKHYRKWHQQFAPNYLTRPQARYASGEVPSEPSSSASRD